MDVKVEYGQLKAEFSGNPEEVFLSFADFLRKAIPGIDLAHKISASFSTRDLIEKFQGAVRITPEGPRVWTGDSDLSDKELVALQLVATKIGFETGRHTTSDLSLAELQSATGLKAKSISSRLSEATKLGHIGREQSTQGVRYRITTQGVDWLSRALAKKTGKSA